MAPPSANEPTVPPFAPMPHGYIFVRKGNVYITGHCRKQTGAAGQTVYTVVNKKNQTIGIRVPQDICNRVRDAEAATRADRANVVAKKDSAMDRQFASAVMEIFPKVPKSSIPQIVATAMRKGSGHVGRTGKLNVREKARLGVVAHIRHCRTNYDHLLKEGVSRDEARKKVWPKIDEALREWSGRPTLQSINKKKDDRANKSGEKTGAQNKGKVTATKATTTRVSAAKPKQERNRVTKASTKTVPANKTSSGSTSPLVSSSRRSSLRLAGKAPIRATYARDTRNNRYSGPDSPLRSRQTGIQRTTAAGAKSKNEGAGKSLLDGLDDDDESDEFDEFKWLFSDDDEERQKPQEDEDGDIEMMNWTPTL